MAEETEDWSKYAVKESPKDEWSQYAVKSDTGNGQPSPEDVYKVSASEAGASKDQPTVNVPVGNVEKVLRSPAVALYEGIKGGAKDIKRGSQLMEGGLGDQATGSLKILEGVAKGAFGALNVLPPVAAFTMGIEASGKVVPEQYMEHITAPIKTMLNDPMLIGSLPEPLLKASQSEAGQSLAGLADIAAQAMLIHGISKGVKAVKENVKGIDEVAEKIRNGEPLTPDQVNTATQAVSNLTPQDLQQAAHDMVINNLPPEAAHLKDQEIKLTQDQNAAAQVLGEDAAKAIFQPKIQEKQVQFEQQQANLATHDALTQAHEAIPNEEGKKLIDEKLKEVRANIDALAEKPKEEGINVGTAASEQMINKGGKLGFTKEQVDAMSKEERELLRTATSKDDVNQLLEKYYESHPPKTEATPEANQEGIKSESDASKIESTATLGKQPFGEESTRSVRSEGVERSNEGKEVAEPSEKEKVNEEIPKAEPATPAPVEQPISGDNAPVDEKVQGEKVGAEVPGNTKIKSLDEANSYAKNLGFPGGARHLVNSFAKRFPETYRELKAVADKEGRNVNVQDIPHGALMDFISDKAGMKEVVPTEKNTNLAVNEKASKSAGKEQSDTQDRGRANSSEAKAVRRGTPKSRRKIRDKRYLEALNQEPTSPYDRVLQHFIGGGEINHSAIRELFGGGGKSVKGEMQAKIHITEKNAPSIKELAHQLWEERPQGDERFTDQDYREAVEQVLLDHNSRKTMVDEILKKNNVDQPQEYGLEHEGIDSDIIQQAEDIYDRLGEEEHNKLHEAANTDEYFDKIIEDDIKSGEVETRQSKIEQVKAEISDGIHAILSKAGAVKNLNELQKTKLYDDIVKVVENLVKLGKLSLEEAVDASVKSIREWYGKEDPTGSEEVVKKVQERFAKKQVEKGLTHAETDVEREAKGLEERQKRESKSDAQLEAEADAKIKEGYDVEKLAHNLLENKEAPTDVEHVILSKYAAILDKKLAELDPKSPEFDKTLSDIDKIYRAAESGGSEAGAALGIRARFKTIGDESLSDYFIKEKELNNGAELTDAQKEQVVKEFNEISKAKKELEQKLADMQRQHEEDLANKALQRQVRKTTRRVSREKLDEEFENLSKELSKTLGGTLSAGLNPEAVGIVAKMVANRVQKGVIKLADVIDEVHTKVGGAISKEDIRDVIAGKYAEKKQTRNEITKQLHELRTEAKLIEKYEKLKRGEEPSSEKAKILRNQNLEALRKQIKEHDLSKLADYKKRKQAQIAKLEKDLATNNIEPEVKKPEILLDKAGKALKDKYIKLRQEREIRLLRQEYEGRTRYEKIKDKALEVLNVPRTLMSSMDFSAPLRQGLVAGIANPKIAVRAGEEMFRQAFSQKRFDRWFHDVKDDPRYVMSKESGLYIADPHDPRLTVKEEAFMNNLAEKIPLVGKLVKGSERAYVGYLNKMRWDIFNRFADLYEESGKTFDNSPKLYKAMADYVNNSTGRGKIGALEPAAPVLNSVFFAPRLIASRINLLTNWANPKFYSSVPKEIRVQYFKDMAKFIGVGLTVLSLAKLNGAKVEEDPRSSDFGKIVSGNTRWDIWGGHQQYIRIMAEMLTGKKVPVQGGVMVLGQGRNKSRGDELLKFARGKLAPIPSIAVDVLSGKMYSGEKVSLKAEAEDHLLPLLYNDVKDAVKDKGVQAVFTVGIPSAFGVGVQTYLPKSEKKSSDQETLEKGPLEKGALEKQ